MLTGVAGIVPSHEVESATEAWEARRGASAGLRRIFCTLQGMMDLSSRYPCVMSPINWLLRNSRERWAQDRMTRRTMCSRVHCVYYDPTSLYSGPLVKHT